MNSDPHESAAWRTFGMLDSDEASAFDEAMRHDPELRNAYREMDCLATAVAVTATVPIEPRAGQLERLHSRLGLNPSKRTNWFGISGWAAAAVLTMILILQRSPENSAQVVVNQQKTPKVIQPTGAQPVAPEIIPTEEDDSNVAREVEVQKDSLPVASVEHEGKDFVKVETKRLIQEIEVLRDKLENFQERDRKRFEPVAGMAWPIVMRMVPPGSTGKISNGLALNKDEPPMSAILADALATAAVASGGNGGNVVRISEIATQKAEASAIPIYDAARDTGTLVVSNLSNTPPGTERYLWVTTQEGGSPIYVGRLPESNNLGADSFDFSLGSTGIVPSAFLLTEGSAGQPVTPSAENTILQGPH